jgi:hypothetical protein
MNGGCRAQKQRHIWVEDPPQALQETLDRLQLVSNKGNEGKSHAKMGKVWANEKND